MSFDGQTSDDDLEAADDFDEDGDSDVAYESYIDDQLADLFADGTLELRADATERIRQRILDSSPTYLSLVTSELAKAEILLSGETPDLAGAFFHAYRSLDGYLAAVIINPISEVLMKPISSLFVEDKLTEHRRTIARVLGKDLRNPMLERICSVEEIRKELMEQIQAFDVIKRLRNRIVHGFEEPTREQVERCRIIARRTADLIEAERRRARSSG
jgi:hypothetical protein